MYTFQVTLKNAHFTAGDGRLSYLRGQSTYDQQDSTPPKGESLFAIAGIYGNDDKNVSLRCCCFVNGKGLSEGVMDQLKKSKASKYKGVANDTYSVSGMSSTCDLSLNFSRGLNQNLGASSLILDCIITLQQALFMDLNYLQ